MRNPIDSAAIDPRPSADAARDSIADRARRDVERGAVTADYEANRDAVLELLDAALATELVCTLRYRRHGYAARGLRAKNAADEFFEHAQQELEHADRICARITQLGGKPDLRPETIAERSHADYVECETIDEMITENLVAERIAIENYRSAIQRIGDKDPTTRRLLESILEVEEEHAEDLVGLLPA